MQNYFENRNGSIYVLRDCELFIAKANIEELPSGNLDCILFGSLLVMHDPKGKTDYWTIVLATRVEIAIYAPDQWFIDENDHYVISFKEGDKFIERDTVASSIKNVSDVFNILINGNVSPMIPREQYYQIVLNSMSTNEKLSFPKVFLEIVLAELFLDSSKKYPARLAAEKQNGVPVSINESVLAKNTFNSLTFEDWSKTVYYNKKKSFSDQEKDPSIMETYMRK